MDVTGSVDAACDVHEFKQIKALMVKIKRPAPHPAPPPPPRFLNNSSGPDKRAEGLYS